MRPPRYGKGGLTRYAAMMADKLKTPGLSAAEQARIQRAVDQGFTNIAYHSTHEPWDEIDLNYTDIGLHAGTPTQAANRALDKAIQAKLQKHRSEGKYIPHTNVVPFAYRPGKSLRVTDVGEFKDAMTTLLGLRSNPELKGQAWIDDLLDYVEPEKMSYTPEGQEADWLTDTANLMALADIRQNLRGMGYDTVVYPNQIENAYKAQTELLPEAEARLAAMKQAADALYQKGKSLSPAVPDLNASEEDLARFLAAGDPLDYLSPDERALYEKYRDESYGIRQDLANYDNPNSVIFLDPSGVRSVNAQFAPEAIGETGLFKRDGGPVAFGRGGVNQIAEQAAEIKNVRDGSALDISRAGSKISALKEFVRQKSGEYAARRVERAADEIPNLGRQYSDEALRRAFMGDNTQLLMTMPPGSFEDYAARLIPGERYEIKDSNDRLAFDDYIDYLGKIARGDGLSDVPFLTLKQLKGYGDLEIKGHEGRHRTQALTRLGDDSTLIRLYPEGYLREEFPRRDREEFIQSFRNYLGEDTPLVMPEKELGEFGESLAKRRPKLRLPEFYAGGGLVDLAQKYADGGLARFGRGGVNQIAEQAAAAARAAGKAADAVEQAPTEGLSAASMIPMAESVIKLGKKGVSTARKAVDELREIFQENPLNPRELVTNGAAATVYPVGDKLRLSDIRTFAPGQGNASQALRSVLEVADRNKVPVTLTAKNYTGEGLTTAQLVDWYKRNGFEITRDLGDDGVDMIRQPRGVAEEIPGTARQMLDEVSPLVMYRGLTRAIDPTKTRGVNKLIFMSPDPQVASGYALNNKLFGLPSEDMQTTDWAERQLSNAREFDPEAAPNVFKLNIRPQNTFDFQNEAHIAQLEKDLPKILARATPSREPYTRREIKDTIEGIKKGRWQYIEDVAQNTDFFEKAGFDSLYVDEGGVKNLGVFDPTLIKSAIGNEGTFDPTNPVITKAEGGLVFDQDRINALADQLGAPRMAEGGEVKMRDGGEYDSAGAFAQLEAAERAARLRGATPLERYTYETLGMEPGLDRATFLPIAGRGEDRQLAAPGILYDIGKALMTPGAAASGVPVSVDDTINLASNVMGGGLGISSPVEGAVAGMAIKQKGGNWLTGVIESAVAPFKTTTIAGETPAQRIPRHEQLLLDPSLNADQLDRVRYQLGVARSEAALDNWIDKALTKYIRNEMGTPEDPVRIQADAWPATQADLLAKKDAQIAKANADMEKARAERGFTPEMMTRSQAQIRELQKERDSLAAQIGLHMPSRENVQDYIDELYQVQNRNKRARAGMPPAPMGVSPEARFWETLTDKAIDPSPAKLYKRNPANFVDDPWLKQVPDTAMVNSVLRADISGNFGFDHLIDEMRNALNPESGLPRELLINPKDLPKLTVPQMVERVSKINAWRAVQKAEADAAIAANAATFPYRTYETIPGTTTPNERGLRWVELKTPEDGSSDALKDALKYEGKMLQHCVGGYCPDVEAGRSRIFSLRDAAGQPHVTIEVKPGDRIPFAEAKNYLDRDRPELDENEKTQALFEAGFLDERGNVLPDEPSRIIQIKGKQNQAPVVEYLPFVQDFVRGGRWSDVGDLRHTGLYRADPDELGMFVPQNPALQELPGRRADYLRRAQQAGLFGDRQYLTREEWEGILRQQIESESGRLPNQGYAEGGLVGLHAKYEDGGVVKMNAPKEITLADLLRRYAPEAVVDVMDELGQLRGAYNAGLETQIAPDEGGLPGLALQTASLPELPGALVTLAGAGVAAIDPETGLGIIDAGDKYAAMLPEDIASYSARYDAHLDRMLEKYGLPATGSLDPLDRFALAAGEMTGQLPMPAAWLNKLKAAKRIPKAIPLLAEYFGPVVDPKVANYAVGTTVGGALRQLEEPAPEKATLTYSPPAFPKMAEGGAFDADRINAMADQLMGKPQAFARGGIGRTADRAAEGAERAALTAAERAEAGRRAAQRIKMQEELKASEALGRARELGIQRVHATQSDRTRVGGGNIGGPAFSALSRVHPSYWDYVWGVGKPQTAQRLINLSQPGSAWTTLLGGADQLKSNPIVFDKLKRGFLSSMKAGALSDELADKINKNLALTFGEGVDIRDPSIWDLANTYDARAALADVMMGKGINPKKGGVALGGEKSGQGVIFRPSDILRRETEPGLLHTEHGGDVPTFAVGPRLFTLRNEIDVRPDLHPGYPVLIRGQDLDVKYAPVPIEIFMPDWHKKFADVVGSRKPGYYDYTMGLINEGLPSQEITDKYLKYLMSEGFADGGSVSYLQHLTRV